MPKTLKEFIAENSEPLDESFLGLRTDIPPYRPTVKESEEMPNKKPFVSVKRIPTKYRNANYTDDPVLYKVVDSTHRSFKSGDELTNKEYLDLSKAHPDDIHLKVLAESAKPTRIADNRSPIKNHTLIYDALSGKVHYTTDNRFEVGETLSPNELESFLGSDGVSKHQPTSAELELLPSNVEGSYGKVTVARYRAT
jgi:hypothetical protein